jgi:acetyl esterase/lipase
MIRETIIYKSENSFNLKADFYGSGEEQAPVIFYIHGGGLIWGSRKDISEEMIQLYTDNGFSIFSIDYRLAPETKLAEMLKDVEDALIWLKTEGANRFSIDPNKIAAVGGSAGGFLALHTGTFKNKPNAIVSFYGYGDISSNWATNPSAFYRQKEIISRELAMSLLSDIPISEGPVEKRYLIYLYARQQGMWVKEITGVNPSFDREAIINMCPIHLVDENFSPTLFLHGTADTDVPYEQSVFMRAALLKKGVTTRLVTIPNGEHVFEKNYSDPTVQDSLRQVIEFLKVSL